MHTCKTRLDDGVEEAQAEDQLLPPLRLVAGVVERLVAEGVAYGAPGSAKSPNVKNQTWRTNCSPNGTGSFVAQGFSKD